MFSGNRRDSPGYSPISFSLTGSLSLTISFPACCSFSVCRIRCNCSCRRISSRLAAAFRSCAFSCECRRCCSGVWGATEPLNSGCVSIRYRHTQSQTEQVGEKPSSHMLFMHCLHGISFAGCIQKRRNRGKFAFPRLPGFDNDALRRRQTFVVLRNQ